MPYRIVFAPEAVDQIVSRYDYIVADGSPLIAERYTSAIVNYCEGHCQVNANHFKRATTDRVNGSIEPHILWSRSGCFR